MGRFHTSRRAFSLGLAALAGAGWAGRGTAQEMLSVTTSLGTYDIPADPQRVVAIDPRLDLEPALALGLPVIAYSLTETVEPWVPVSKDAVFLGAPASRENVLVQDPDMIICTDIPGSEYWPIDKLKDIAPTLPVDYEMDWKQNLVRIGDWLGRAAAAQAFIDDYLGSIAALQAKYRAVLAEKKLAALWYEAEGNELQALLGTGTSNVTLAGQVLDDIGGKTVDQGKLGEYGIFSMENAIDVLGDVNAIIFDGGDDDGTQAALEANDIWKRIPAVAAGRVYWTTGIFYGGGYGAKRLVGEWDKTLALVG